MPPYLIALAHSLCHPLALLVTHVRPSFAYFRHARDLGLLLREAHVLESPSRYSKAYLPGRFFCLGTDDVLAAGGDD